ncbi:MAG: 30S ribosomal protein S17 [Patulibacter sp.]|nr:30S ribosomal protein S17 [Patulibacter sp.]MDO9407292.1 30S ribosomal protein S17 [Patulibacter sp.]
MGAEAGTDRGTPTPEWEPGRKQVRQGVVVSAKGDKTLAVRIDHSKRHPKYKKIVRHTTKLYAHDEQNDAGEGDTVRIESARPLSRTKRWTLAEIVERAK